MVIQDGRIVYCVQAVSVLGESSLPQGVQAHHQVAAVLLARYYHGLPQHVYAYVRASSATVVAR